MKKRLSLKNENRGAALLAVLVVLVVVTAIAAVITRLTIVNIGMKEVERGTKKNFYSADAIMEQLRTGAAGKSSEAMQTAYEYVMQNYLSITENGGDLQSAFADTYIKELEETFADSAYAFARQATKEYATAQYSVDTLKGCIADTACQTYVQTVSTDAVYEADYKDGVFSLKNVKVVCANAQGYETTITTDLVFSTPSMQFSSADGAENFMKYALIADQQISVDAANVKVTGNVYAGCDGIEATLSGSGTFSGDTILTRGDIVTTAGTSLTIDGSAIWAENIRTEGKGSSTMTLSGSCYVADDLTLAGVGSKVSLSGNYYGYNFQQNYGTTETTTDAKYSSAMLINGTNSTLSLEGLTYLMLAGRTYIARDESSGSDVMLGESLSARTNQLAYYVPERYLDKSAFAFTDAGAEDFEKDTGVSDITSYLDETKQVVPYYYVENGNEKINYYLNFESEQKANDYFAEYLASDTNTLLAQYATKYVTDNAIVINDDCILTLKGDVMYRSAAGAALTGKTVTIGSAWGENGVYYNYCAQLAVKYKALQLGLTETNTNATKDNVRMTEDAAGKKSSDSLFKSLVDKDELVNRVALASGQCSRTTYALSGGNADVILTDNSSTSTYLVPTDVTRGLIVATGDVRVQGSFTGLILCGGTVSFSDNATVTADEALVMELFAADSGQENPSFSDLFAGYTGSLSSSAAAEIDAGDWLGYENWRKNRS